MQSLLKNRIVIKVLGADAFKFLQGMLTNDLTLLDQAKVMYSYFLTPNGRYCCDMFIHKTHDGYFLDIPEANHEVIIRKLLMYKLRSEVAIEKTNLKVAISSDEGVEDPRSNLLPKRILADDATEYNQSFINQYDLIRINNLIPDASDLTFEKSLILHFRAESLSAVSFTKGCYLGQEVTSRMRYREAIKKTLCKIVGPSPLHGGQLFAQDNEVGTILSAVENQALALITKEALESNSVFLDQSHNEYSVTCSDK